MPDPPLRRRLGLSQRYTTPSYSYRRIFTDPRGRIWQLTSDNAIVFGNEGKYLDGALGTAQTVDTPNLTITGDVRWTAKVRDDSAEAATSRHVFDRRGNGSTTLAYSWATFSASLFAVGWPLGTVAPQINPSLSRTLFGLTPPGVDRYVGYDIEGVNPASSAVTMTVTGTTSPNGITWSDLGAGVVRADAYSFESDSILRIASTWIGRIYWAQMERINKRAFVFPGGTAVDRLQVPDDAAFQISGDITIVADLSPTSWTPPLVGWVTSRGSSFSVNGMTYLLFHNTNGTLQLSIDSPSGLQSFISPVLTDLGTARRKIAVSLDVDNGAAGKVHEWLTSTDDGNTWTVLATTTVGSTTSIKTTAALNMMVGGRGSTSVFEGEIYGISIRNGIGAPGTVGGTEVLSIKESNASALAAGATTPFTSSSGHTVSVFQEVSNQVIQTEPDEVIWRFDAEEYPFGPIPGPTVYFPQTIQTVDTTGIQAPTTDIDLEYEYLFYETLSGNFIGALPGAYGSYGEVLRGPGGGEIHLPLYAQKGGRAESLGRAYAEQVTSNSFEEYTHCVAIKRNGVCVWSGFIGRTRVSSADRRVNIALIGYWDYFRNRLIRYSFDTGPTEDVFTTVRNLINNAQSDGPSSDIGLTMGSELSGIPANLKINSYDFRYVGDVIEGLAKSDNNFDFDIETQFGDSGALLKTLRLGAPKLGRRTEYVLEWGRNMYVYNYERDGDVRKLGLWGIGAGEGDNLVLARSLDSAAFGRTPLREGTIQRKDLDATQQGSLQRLTDGEIRKYAGSVQILNCTIDAADAVGVFTTGDSVRVVIDDGFTQIDQFMRVLTTLVRVQDNLSESMDIDLGPEWATGA